MCNDFVDCVNGINGVSDDRWDEILADMGWNRSDWIPADTDDAGRDVLGK